MSKKNNIVDTLLIIISGSMIFLLLCAFILEIDKLEKRVIVLEKKILKQGIKK